MGKKVKKKPKTVQKEKRAPSETPDDGIKDRGTCSHIDRGINLDKLSAKLPSSESFKCDDCRGNSVDRRAKKGKGKNGKGGINTKSESKAIWICLECGHFSCGGVGLPTTPQSHAVRHAKQHHHWLVVHCENHQLLWCFSCDKLITAEKLEDSKDKQVLSEVVKRLKKKPGEGGSTVNVEDIWFGSTNETNATSSDHSASIVAESADGRIGYSVRGLSNLGNTCFFNSIMQNLLAINSLRDYFLKSEESIGPLTSALRKLFVETNTGSAIRSVINPRSLFGSLCTKAPQFKGSQQQDSHELLRCLLDSLSSEELSTRKKHTESSQAPITGPTFVDAVFGGQISSAITCLECGHSSTINEPFLDLSLSVPTKKPPAKRNQPVTRGKKSKLLPKRSTRNLAKISRDAKLPPRECVSDQSISDNSLSAAAQAEELVLSSGDFDRDSKDIAVDMGLTDEDLSAIRKPENQQVVENVGEPSISLDTFSWLDYLDENPVSLEIDVASETDAISANEDVHNAVSVSVESRLVNDISVAEQENAFSHSEGNQNVNPQLNEEVVIFDGEPARCSDSCSQVFSKDSNTSQVKDSEVNSLTNEGEASARAEVSRAEIEVSSVVLDDKQDPLDFDGFGDLFNEPEAPVSEASDVTNKNGVVGNSSESDPDQVDNADAPVSVESCLAFFMKPELLSKDEHAWQCENCSKILREQSRRLSKFQMPNGCGNSNTCNEVMSTNENKENTETEPNLMNAQSENTEPQNTVPCRMECEFDKEGFAEIDLLSAKCESEVSEQDEVNSEDSKVKRDATKSILINKAPSILTIHLKRFIQDNRGRLNKLHGHVNFGETVDLKPYMDPRCSEKERFTYRLVGVVEHQGTMRGGHYVAYVRGTKDNGNCVWYHTSDAYIGEASFDDVLRSEAYILFYEEI